MPVALVSGQMLVTKSVPHFKIILLSVVRKRGKKGSPLLTLSFLGIELCCQGALLSYRVPG